MSEQITEPVEEQTIQPDDAPVKDGATSNGWGINDDGTFTDEFYSKLPEDLGQHSSVKTIKSIEDLAKSYVNTKSLVGKKFEDYLKSDDPELVAKRNEVMGVPSSVEDYDLKMPEVPEGSPFNEDVLNNFKEKAAELGITKDQAQALLEWDAGRAVNAQENIQQTIEQQTEVAETELKKEWGNKFEYNLAQVERAADYLGVTDDLVEMGLNRNPQLVKSFFEKIVPAISDDKLIESKQSENFATISDNLQDVETKMYSWEGSTRDPEYLTLVKQRTELLGKLAK